MKLTSSIAKNIAIVCLLVAVVCMILREVLTK